MEDLSAHILDIVENSINAKAGKIEIAIDEDPAGDRLVIEIGDDGRGMNREQLERVFDPFFTSRTTRRVGLGLPLLAQSAEATGGDVEIQSREGSGTCVRAVFSYGHIDRQPMGDLAETLRILVGSHPGIRFVFRHRDSEGTVIFDTAEIGGGVDGDGKDDVSGCNPDGDGKEDFSGRKPDSDLEV